MVRVIQDSWIREYLKYSQGTEAPDLFHIWVAISAIASCMERNIYIDRGHFNLYPNMYIILVAGAGRMGKSTAIRMGASKIVKNLDNAPRFFAEKITNARLIQFLAEGVNVDEKDSLIKFDSSGYIVASELSTFLGKTSSDAALITTLTDLYDCPKEWDYETKGSGKDKLENPCINMIGGSTGHWLRHSIPMESVGGGFASRIVFVYQDEPRPPIANPEDHVPENFETMQENLINDLSHIRTLKGRFEYPKESKQWYKNWYKDVWVEMVSKENSDFYSRWRDLLLKVAMVVSISRRDTLVITVEDLKESWMYLSAVKASMAPIIDTMTVTESELPTSKVLGVIRRRGHINHERLAKYTSRFVRSDGLKQIIETLEEAGLVSVSIKQGDKRRYEYIGKEEDINV